MKNLEHVCYNTRFSHIYVERRIRNHPRTEQILLRFPQAQIVEIEHYKDVFNRHGQDGVRQHQAQALILAEKTDHFFYEGALRLSVSDYREVLHSRQGAEGLS